MKLVLAEKPSVAMSLSKVIGADQRGDGYMEGNGYLVSWCVGHLVELSQPEAYDEKYAKWRYDDLPILPEHWQYQVSASTKKQFGILKKLMQRKDVESLICATDAGREGELIFRLVYHQCGCKKPVERLWISSMEDSAIREGFQKLRPGTEYDALYEAALCRERADWIVGINATRLFSCLYGQTLNVGRVMTPTLAMVVMRDAAIRAFKPEPFYSAELKFRDFQAGGERMKEKAEAEKLVAECCQAGSAIITKVEQKEKSEKPPALFDLTSLQREANRQLGFTAQQTLDYTQALYEKKLVTYPRTDSRYLTDDMAPLVPELVSVIQQSFQIQPDAPAPVNAAQVINSKKVTDHHAIIPTKTAAGYDISSLPSGEQAILTMLAVRLICAVGTPCRYAETIVEAECAGQKFRTKCCSLNSRFGIHATVGHFIYTGKSCFFLPFRSFQLLTRSFIISDNLFKLDRSSRISFHEVLISFPVFFQFRQPYFNLGNRRIVNRCCCLRGIECSIDDGRTGLRIFQGSFSLHHANFIFTIIQYQQSISFMYLLMFCKVDFVNVT